jgi:aminoglycoside phosphotransferase (APT) family kinase protein
MKFIRDNTTMPVPKVLSAYEKEGCRYILMEYIEGEVLERAWPNLSSSERGLFISQLQSYVREMRQIAVPDGTRIGSVNGGPATDRRSQGSVKGGPFESEADFNEWQIAQLQPHTRSLHREIYSSMHKTDHKVVFSHCDLGFHNILVRDGQAVAVIDWEDSGWYLEHWDYCKTLSFLSATDEQYLCCKEMFGQPYHSEFLMDSWFTREVRHGGF